MQVEKDFEVNYFLVMVDMAISSLKIIFQGLRSFNGIFGFLMNSISLKSLDGVDLKVQRTKFVETFSSDGSSNVDINDLISELCVMHFTLLDRATSAMENFEFVIEADCVILTFPLLIKSYSLCL